VQNTAKKPQNQLASRARRPIIVKMNAAQKQSSLPGVSLKNEIPISSVVKPREQHEDHH
jgi:hypothetical protein